MATASGEYFRRMADEGRLKVADRETLAARHRVDSAERAEILAQVRAEKPYLADHKAEITAERRRDRRWEARYRRALRDGGNPWRELGVD